MELELNLNSVVAAVFVVFATFMILRALWHAIAAVESRRWPEARGVILTSRLERSHGVDGDELTNAAVTYRFLAGGQERIGRRACFGDSTATSISSMADRLVRRYRIGQVVSVRYNPEKIEDCVLEPGLNGHILFEFVFGAIFLAFGILALRAAA